MDVPPPHTAFGFNENADVGGFDPAEVAQAAHAAGASARRFTVDWRGVEKSRDVWDEDGWGYADAAYRATLAAGMTPVIDFGFAPQWAREAGAAQACADFYACRYPPADDMDDEWVEFAAEVARRFPRAVLEVWNEPNLAIFWRPQVDPERFAELQALAYTAIKDVDPSITVLAGGLSAVQPPGTALVGAGPADLPLREYLARSYDAGLGAHMDALSFHPYPFGNEMGAGSVFAAAFDDVRAVAAANDDPDAALWVTETGVPSAGRYAVSESEQKALLLRLYRRLATMSDVDGFLFHRLFPPETDSPGSDEWGYALASGGGPGGTSPKPAFCTLVTAAHRSFAGC